MAGGACGAFHPAIVFYWALACIDIERFMRSLFTVALAVAVAMAVFGSPVSWLVSVMVVNRRTVC